MSLANNVEIEKLASEQRKKQVAQAVQKHRKEQQEKTGRKQAPLMLTDEDRKNMALIKKNEESVRNQGEAVSLALAEFVTKYGTENSE